MGTLLKGRTVLDVIAQGSKGDYRGVCSEIRPAWGQNACRPCAMHPLPGVPRGNMPGVCSGVAMRTALKKPRMAETRK